MNTTLATCKHTYDNGEHCNSAAAHGRDYCTYHLRNRARLLRMAQARARSERFDLKLPPLESMATVLSAVNQLVETVAADMIDLKRADFLLKSLRFAAQALKSSDQWRPSVFHTDQAAPAIDLAAEYGLPDDLDLNTPPEVAFPESVILSEERSDESKSRRFAGVGAGSRDPERAQRVEGDPYVSAQRDRAPLFPEIPPPYVRDYAAEAEAALFEATPQDMELNEILHTEGYKAMESRAKEHHYNERRRTQRKLFRANYERYVAEAKLKNVQRAAGKLVAEKLAAEKAAAQTTNVEPASIRKQPTSSVASDTFAGMEDAIA